jgi:DNA helicase-2/ATP-dependent DNA helicase PcrA
MLIKLSEKTIEKCRTFAEQVSLHQHSKEFRNSNTEPRSLAKMISDSFIGRLGEEAVLQLFREHDLHAELDYNIYESKDKGDDQDIVINGVDIEVKSAGSQGNWLLVDLKNIENKKKIGKEPMIYVFCVVKLFRETPFCEVDVRGFSTKFNLNRNTENTQFVARGEYIPNTNCIIKTDNYAIHSNHLYKDFELLSEKIRKRN